MLMPLEYCAKCGQVARIRFENGYCESCQAAAREEIIKMAAALANARSKPGVWNRCDNTIVGPINCFMHVGVMKPGTRFKFRNEEYIRCDKPFGMFDNRNQEGVSLAVHVASGEITPFFDDQTGQLV